MYPTPRDMTPDEVRAWRDSRSLTQQQAADTVGVGHRTWWRWETEGCPAKSAAVLLFADEIDRISATYEAATVALFDRVRELIG